jgi:hypothetical protein
MKPAARATVDDLYRVPENAKAERPVGRAQPEVTEDATVT